jgi:16S rRNA C967 or C1407 C5-methylase (RsmB/RsmF family)
VYATCSVWPEENQQLIAECLKLEPTIKLEREIITPPNPASDATQYHDGGYVAVLSR